MFRILAFLSIAIILSVSGQGLVLPDSFTGSFEASSKDGTFLYKGTFSKKTEGSTWLIEGLSQITEREPYDTTQTTSHYYRGSLDFNTRSLTHPTESIHGCYPPSDIPPLEDLKTSFENAKKISNPNGLIDQISCPNGELWELTFTNQFYVLCVENRLITKIYSNEFTATVQITPNPKIKSNLERVSRCPVSTSSVRYTSYLENIEIVDRWYWKNGSVLFSSVGQKDCFFLHGSGVVPDDGVGGFPAKDYWGSVVQYTPQCKTWNFNQMDTRNRGWDDVDSQKEVCAFVTQFSKNNLVENAIIFSHSLGNLALLAGIKNGICDLSETTNWYGIQGPLLGTKAASFVEAGCQDPLSAVSVVAAATGDYCQGRQAYPVYKTMTPTFYPWNELTAIAERYLKGNMCGSDCWGLHTIYSPALCLIDTLSGLEASNDGMVPLTSCALSGSYQTSSKSAFYKLQGNHADGTCRNGNGWWGNDRQPCDWFKHRL